MQNRLKKRIGRVVFNNRSRNVSKTSPISCMDTADCDIYSMVSRNDLGPYLLAIKSILRYFDGVAVTAFDDGSLTASDRVQLETHVPRIRVITAEEADLRAAEILGKSTFLYQQRGVYLSWRRLIDMQLYRRSKKIINLDTDVLCPNRPTALIEWIKEESPAFVLGQCNGPETKEKLDGILPPSRLGNDASSMPTDIQSLFLRHLDELCKRMRRPVRFLDGGCAGVHGFTDEISLEDVETLLHYCKELNIPMNQWGAEQSTVLYLLSTSNGQRLPTDTNFNFFPDRISSTDRAELVHFIGLYRFHKNIYAGLAKRLISELNSGDDLRLTS